MSIGQELKVSSPNEQFAFNFVSKLKHMSSLGQISLGKP